MRKTIHIGLVFLVLTLFLQGLAHAQAKGKRLILKDGSYQIATQWEVKGDRVRYFSAERFMWEELPNSMVDWPATDKYQKDRAAGNLAEQNSISIEENAERKAEEARSPTIAPGLRLPESGGVFLLDNYQTRPQLVELVQNGSEINKQTSKNILRSVINPIPSGPRQTVELKGNTARIKSHTETPTIYVDVNFDPDDDSGIPKPTGGPEKPSGPAPAPAQRFKIVRLQQKQDVRVVSNLKVALTGRIKEEQSLIDTTSEALSTDWIKITPAAPLAPGEYAVVEMLSPKQMNIFVWDFTVDPKAPANAAAWVPAPPARTDTGTERSPVLENRPVPKQKLFDVGTNISPRSVDNPDPQYTKQAQDAKLEGTVYLRVLVGEDGVPIRVSLIRGLGYGLDEEAVNTVKKWKFPKINRSAEVSVEVNFHLYNGGSPKTDH